MDFAGLQKLTLLDYPGVVACTLFTRGCDFRCPFCHNSSILDAKSSCESIPEADVLAFLKKRRGILDGICVTGGEPLLHAELPAFLKKIKAMGYRVKLDTNGSFPDRLRALISAGLIDTVAMDIKNSPNRYSETIGVPGFDLAPVTESVALLNEGRIPYEFRTTVVAEYHTEADMLAIGQWLRGNEPYFLQAFVDSPDVLKKGLHAVPREQMERFRELLLPMLPNTMLRGI